MQKEVLVCRPPPIEFSEANLSSSAGGASWIRYIREGRGPSFV